MFFVGAFAVSVFVLVFHSILHWKITSKNHLDIVRNIFTGVLAILCQVSFLITEAVVQMFLKNVFLNISQYFQENICVGVSC